MVRSETVYGGLPGLLGGLFRCLNHIDAVREPNPTSGAANSYLGCSDDGGSRVRRSFGAGDARSGLQNWTAPLQALPVARVASRNALPWHKLCVRVNLAAIEPLQDAGELHDSAHRATRAVTVG